MSTSSPGFTSAMTMLYSVCLAPQETVTSSGAYSSPWSRLSLWQTAARSSAMPPTSVYLVWPLSSARTAASLMRFGVSKSGSPTLNEITSMPWARMARALAFMARVAEGTRVFKRSASMGTLLSDDLDVSLGQARLHHGRDQAGDRRPQRGDLLDEAGRDIGVALVRHHEHRLHGAAQLAVHERHLELVLEVRHRANAAHDAVGALTVDEVDEEPVEGRDTHVSEPMRGLVDQLEALLDAEERLLGRVGHHRDDELVEDAEAPLDEVEVSVVHRVEHPRIDRPLAHGEPPSSCWKGGKSLGEFSQGRERKSRWCPRTGAPSSASAHLETRAAAPWSHAGPPPARREAARRRRRPPRAPARRATSRRAGR